MVEFIEQGDGIYLAVIDHVELKVWPTGYELMYGATVDTECDYDGCESKEYENEPECVRAPGGHCPSEKTIRQQIDNRLVGGLASMVNVEKQVKTCFARCGSTRSQQ